MHIFKKIIIATVAALGMFVATSAFAQTATTTATVNRVPVYVKNLQLVNNPIHASGTTTGTFILQNAGTSAVSNLYYSVQIRSPQTTSGAATILYTEKLFGPFYLNAGESKKVSFAYKVPSGIGGGMFMVRIQSELQEGEKMGWADLPLQILGSNEFMKVSKTSLIVDGTEYPVGSGPTIHKDETAQYKVTFTNPLSYSVDLTPTLTVYDRTTTSAPLLSSSSPMITVAAHAQKTITIDLPTFNGTPRVYLASLELKNKAGASRSEILMTRYIVDGPIATIHTISADKQAVKNGDTLNLAVTYTGTPLDITTGQEVNNGTATLKLALYNQSKQLIGSQSQDIQLTTTGDTVTVPVQATAGSNGLSVVGQIVKDGKVIDEYTTALSPVASSTPKVTTTNEWAIRGLSFISGLILAFIILIIKRRRNKANIMLPMLLLAFSASLLGYSVFHQHTSLAAFNGDQNDPTNASVTSALQFDKVAPCTSCNTFDIFINTPNSDLNVGQQFTISGNWSFYACENTPPKPTITVTMPNGTPETFNINDSLQGHNGAAESTFSLFASNFKFDAPGDYLVHLKFDSEIYDNTTNGTRHQILEGDLHIHVNAPTTNSDTNIDVVRVDGNGVIMGSGASAQVEPSSWTVDILDQNATTIEDSGTNNPTLNYASLPSQFSGLNPGEIHQLGISIPMSGSNYRHSPAVYSYKVSYGTCVGTSCTPSSYQEIPNRYDPDTGASISPMPGELNCGVDFYSQHCFIPNVQPQAGQTVRYFIKYEQISNSTLTVYRVNPNGTKLLEPPPPTMDTSEDPDLINTNPVLNQWIYSGFNECTAGQCDYIQDNPGTFNHLALADNSASYPGIYSLRTENYFNSEDFDIWYAACTYDNLAATDCSLPAYQQALYPVETDWEFENITLQATDNPGMFCRKQDGSLNKSCIYKYYIPDNHTNVKLYIKYLPKVVISDLTGSCSVSQTPINEGDTAVWTANVSGGTAPYTYSFRSSDNAWNYSVTDSATPKSTPTETYSTAGSYSAIVDVYSADNQHIVPQCPVLTVNTVTPPTGDDLKCKPTNPADNTNISQAPVGKPVRWVVTQNNASEDPVTDTDGSKYVWSGSVSGTGLTITKSYTTTGIKQTQVSYDGQAPITCNIDTPFKVSTSPNYIEF